jgi:hypothetical protein
MSADFPRLIDFIAFCSSLIIVVGDNTYTGQNEIIDGFREHFEVLAIQEGGTN